MLRTSLLAIAGLALVTACGGNDAETASTSTGTVAGDSMASAAPMTGDSATMAAGTAAGTNATLADANTSAQLDSVATAARSGLTALPPAVAVPLIRSLEDKLDNSNDPALTDIAKDLEKLREELDGGQVDGKDVGEILGRLGPKVTNVAGNGGAASGTLRTIGEQLTAAARQLNQ